MVELNPVIVVDNGDRRPDAALSADLAELGYASVTTSLEAVDEVLELLPAPCAILLQLPRGADQATRSSFAEFAERLRGAMPETPVIVIDPSRGVPESGFAALLQAQVGAPAFAKPDHS